MNLASSVSGRLRQNNKAKSKEINPNAACKECSELSNQRKRREEVDEGQ
ncbi:hypothetical protein [Sphingobacterium thalpophilum]|nr:hypothetical protein [Sphingobacterium thalpophilum]